MDRREIEATATGIAQLARLAFWVGVECASQAVGERAQRLEALAAERGGRAEAALEQGAPGLPRLGPTLAEQLEERARARYMDL